MAYLYGSGYGVAQGSLVPLVPQPRTDATIQPVVRSFSASGSIHETGLWIPLLYSMFETDTQYQTLLAQIGLTSALTAAGTWYLPDHAFTWRRYNGLAHRPQQGNGIKRQDYFIRDGTILVSRLVAL